MSKTRPETSPESVSIPSRDRPETGLAGVSVADAARILGITDDGVRKALRRGTIAGSKDGRGVWRVHLPPQDTKQDESRDRPETGETPPQDTSRDSPDTGLLALVDQLRSENAYLRDELHNTHVLLAQLAGKMPALPAGEDHRSSPTGSVENARPGPSGEAVSGSETDAGQYRESMIVSVWRRLFGRG